MEKETRAGFVGFLLNIVLFAVKLAAGLLSGSLAVLSDAFNSFLDILSYFLVFLSVRTAQQAPDEGHPFGHRRFAPMSAFIIAVFSGVLAFGILKAASENFLFDGPPPEITALTFGAIILSMLVKAGMYLYLMGKSRETHSSSLEAAAIDSRNDVLASGVVLAGIAAVYFGLPLFDDFSAIVIAFVIGWSGYRIAKKNFDYMVGASPGKRKIREICRAAETVKGVLEVQTVRAHYVGDRVHAEIEVLVSSRNKPVKTHAISEKVQKKVEALGLVSRAFVHINYK